jgi:hypothetical protein
MLQMCRETCQVCIVALENDLMDRCIGARHLNRRDWIFQTPHGFVPQLLFADSECQCEPAAAAGNVADNLDTVGPSGAKQHGFGIAVEMRTYVR